MPHEVEPEEKPSGESQPSPDSDWIWSLAELERFTTHEQAAVRKWAVERLRQLDAAALVRLAPQLLADPDRSVRLDTLSELHQWDGELPAQALWELADADDVDAKSVAGALYLLASLGDEEAWTRIDGEIRSYVRWQDVCARRNPAGSRDALLAWGEAGDDADGLKVLAAHFRWWASVAEPADVPRTLAALHYDVVDGDRGSAIELHRRAEVLLERVGADDLLWRATDHQPVEEIERRRRTWSTHLGPTLPGPQASELQALQAALDDRAWDEARQEAAELGGRLLNSLPETSTHAWKEALLDGLAERVPCEPIHVEMMLALLLQMIREATLAQADSELHLMASLELWEDAGELERAELERLFRERWGGDPGAPRDERLAASVYLAGTICDDDSDVSTWVELAKRLAPLGIPWLMLEAGVTVEEALIEVIGTDPASIERLANAQLGADDGTMLLTTLSDQPFRWVSRLVLERLDRLLTNTAPVEVWSCLQYLGDPAALDVALSHWKPGDTAAARCAFLLAGLAGRAGELSHELMEDVARYELRTQELQDEVRALSEMGDAFGAARDQPLTLSLRCTECERVHDYVVAGATYCPEPQPDAPEDWDRFTLSEIITCKSCGVVDRYRLTARASVRLMGETIATVAAEDEWDCRVQFGAPRLEDGTLVTRPSHALNRLRELAAEEPDSGSAWRRLGNARNRYGLEEEAVEAWKRAIEVDEDEAEAAMSLCEEAMSRDDPNAGISWCLACLERLPRAKHSDEMRAAIAREMIGLLRSVAPRLEPPLALMAFWPGTRAGKKQTVHLSSIDLRDIPDWDGLAELLASKALTGVRFTTELPEETPTQLETLLASRVRITEMLEALVRPDEKRERRKAARARGKKRGKKKGKRR